MALLPTVRLISNEQERTWIVRSFVQHHTTDAIDYFVWYKNFHISRVRRNILRYRIEFKCRGRHSTQHYTRLNTAMQSGNLTGASLESYHSHHSSSCAVLSKLSNTSMSVFCGDKAKGHSPDEPSPAPLPLLVCFFACRRRINCTVVLVCVCVCAWCCHNDNDRITNGFQVMSANCSTRGKD